VRMRPPIPGSMKAESQHSDLVVVRPAPSALAEEGGQGDGGKRGRVTAESEADRRLPVHQRVTGVPASGRGPLAGGAEPSPGVPRGVALPPPGASEWARRAFSFLAPHARTVAGLTFKVAANTGWERAMCPRIPLIRSGPYQGGGSTVAPAAVYRVTRAGFASPASIRAASRADSTSPWPKVSFFRAFIPSLLPGSLRAS
jgi:hypothetical protein